MPEIPASRKTLPEGLLDPVGARLKPDAFRFVRYRVDPPVACLTLDRPEYNLLNEAMLRELAAGLEGLS